MEGIRHQRGPKPLDWRSHVNAGKVTAEAQQQLDMLAEMAAHEGVDFYKKAKDYEAGIAGDGKHHTARMTDLLILWGYTRGIIKDTEYRSLQRLTSE